MKEFIKYQHIEKFGTIETSGIDYGTCYIFPKIDGTNGSIWIDEDVVVHYGSRNRELSYEMDNAGFSTEMQYNTNIINFLYNNREYRLFGEWLVPHTLKTYADNAWKKFYVFDVMVEDKYISYEEYQPLLEEYNIEYIPPIAVIKNPTYDRLIGFLDKNTYLIKDGEGTGEGIVIKNYEYTNKFGRQTWAKIVKNEFKANHSKNQVTEVLEKKMVEEDIVNKYITSVLIDKEYAKIVNDSEGWSSKFIPKLLNIIYYCLIKEESWNFIKEFKNPTIDYKRLQFLTTVKIKELKPELF